MLFVPQLAGLQARSELEEESELEDESDLPDESDLEDESSHQPRVIGQRLDTIFALQNSR